MMILEKIGKDIVNGIYRKGVGEMRKEDLFKKNHILGVEFDRYLLEHPELMEQIPDGAEVVFLPEDDPDLLEENFKIAKERGRESGAVVLVRIGKLSPPRSRLQDVRLEAVSQ